MKILTFFIALLIGLISNSSAEEKIEGIGIFKIQKSTITLISDLENELNVKSIIINRHDEFYDLEKKGGKNILVQLVPNTGNPIESPTEANFCPESKVFYLSNYTVAGIEIKKIYLTFYKDILVEFSSNELNPELEEALSLKYGEPVLRIEEKDVPCIFTRTGNKITYKQQTFYQTWKNKIKNIDVFSILGMFYDDKCEKHSYSSFYISADGFTDKIMKCGDIVKRNIEKKEKQEKKKKLSDL